jgi:hypothetical protein
VILFKPNPKIPILNKLPVKPVAAYDINQRLIRSYRGAAFNIRRTLDNSTLDIPFLGNGKIDVHTLSEFLRGSTDGFFTAIYGQISSNHLIQLTANSQPTIMEGGVLNLDSDGNLYANFNSKFMEASLGLGVARSIVAVYQKEVSGVNTHVFGSGKITGQQGVNIFEDSLDRTNLTSATNRYNSTTDTDLNKKIIVGENDGVIEYYKNGIQNVLGSPIATGVESLVISIGTSSFPFQGRFYTGLIFQNKLATNNRRNLERLLGKQNKISVA